MKKRKKKLQMYCKNRFQGFSWIIMNAIIGTWLSPSLTSTRLATLLFKHLLLVLTKKKETFLSYTWHNNDAQYEERIQFLHQNLVMKLLISYKTILYIFFDWTEQRCTWGS